VRAHSEVRVVVSNAGRGKFGSLEEHSYEEIRSLLELNLTAHAFVARAFLPLLKRGGGGHFVLIGSEAALRGSRYGSIYCAAKFGLRGLAQALRQEAATAGVAVSIVNPGMVRTGFFDELDFVPGERPENALEPADVAEAVWLAVSTRAGAVVDEIDLSPLSRVVRKKRRR
jgi:short-subunit dehydrogenase